MGQVAVADFFGQESYVRVVLRAYPSPPPSPSPDAVGPTAPIAATSARPPCSDAALGDGVQSRSNGYNIRVCYFCSLKFVLLLVIVHCVFGERRRREERWRERSTHDYCPNHASESSSFFLLLFDCVPSPCRWKVQKACIRVPSPGRLLLFPLFLRPPLVWA